MMSLRISCRASRGAPGCRGDMTPASPVMDTGVGARSGFVPVADGAWPTDGRMPDFRRAPRRAMGSEDAAPAGFEMPFPCCGGGDRRSAIDGAGGCDAEPWGVVGPLDSRAAKAPLPSRPSIDTPAGGAEAGGATGAATGGEDVDGGRYEAAPIGGVGVSCWVL